LAGLIDLVRRQKIKKDETVLLWHTGGETALHAHIDDLVVISPFALVRIA